MDALPNHIHFLGIAGIGVSALAQLALARGVYVSGSDPAADPTTNPAVARLVAGGAIVTTHHATENLPAQTELVVVSAAVPEDNPEVKAARQRGLRIVSRAEFLGELMAAHHGVKIAVAGTHGKTTTTAMIGVMLQHAGLDPTVFVGGEVEQLGGNVRIGGPAGPFVAEACEAYDSFLYLKPDIAVVTNIEADHLDHYGTLEGVKESFRKFVGNVSIEGTIISGDETCGVLLRQDVPGRRHRSYLIMEPGVRYRLGENGSFAHKVTLQPAAAFTWWCTSWTTSSSQPPSAGGQIRVRLRVPGLHNVLNALAAATVGRVLDIPMDRIVAGLEAFRGAGRRQEILAEIVMGDASILVMDDYAHHPTEIRATLDALRAAYPQRRLVAIFQPHLYSRTRDFLSEFADALATADALIVTDIYPAREAPIPGVHAADIVTLASESHHGPPTIFVPDKRDIPGSLQELVRPGDLTVFLGAGDIREQGERFTRLLSQEVLL